MFCGLGVNGKWSHGNMGVAAVFIDIFKSGRTQASLKRYGYWACKACASLTKLGERYGRECLENACGRILAYGTTPSIRNISSFLKNGQDRPVKAAEPDKPTVFNSYSITRGASYFRKGGDR